MKYLWIKSDGQVVQEITWTQYLHMIRDHPNKPRTIAYLGRSSVEICKVWHDGKIFNYRQVWTHKRTLQKVLALLR